MRAIILALLLVAPAYSQQYRIVSQPYSKAKADNVVRNLNAKPWLAKHKWVVERVVDDPDSPSPVGARILLTDEVVALVRQRWNANDASVSRVKSEAQQGMSRSPNAPSSKYTVPHPSSGSGHTREKARLQNDGIEAYAMSLVYVATGDAEHKMKVIQYLDDWTGVLINNDQQTRLTFSVHFLPLLLAADSIGVWDDADFRVWLNYAKDFTELYWEINGYWDLGQKLWARNNREFHGIALLVAIARFLGDDDLLVYATSQWMNAVDYQVRNNGEMPEETRRSRPVFYTHYALWSATFAAVMLENAGIDVWDHEGKLEKAFDYAAAKFSQGNYRSSDANIGSYVVLQQRWSNPLARNALDRYSPVKPWASVPFVSLTHGD